VARRGGTAAVLLALLAGAPAAAETVRVFAASSLTDAFREAAADFEAAHPGVRVELQLGGSQVLRVQVEQGAPADVFASADREHARALWTAGLVGEPRVFARNRLVVAVPRGPGKVRSLGDLARPGVRLVLAAPSVPAGRYATEALRRLDAWGGLGEGFAAGVRRNVVSEETNVRAVLAKVRLGEADAGFVYATDVRGAGEGTEALALPVDVAVEYEIAVVRASREPGAAAAFVARVLGERGQAILRRHGFR
jgi:molybdate transport system substrate-binding protein